MMKYYLAPLEGITRYIYRNAYHGHFHPMDKYFAPFLAPTQNCSFRHREREDVLPENNPELYLVPQILTNRTDGFLWAVRELRDMGYEEVNLNLGCPSKTVVTRKRGSGFLSVPEELDRFLDQVFTNWNGKISIKTRIGISDADEWSELLRIYNRYPLHELIIHPRLQKDFYRGTPDMSAFRQALSECRHSLCYNGDLFTREDFKAFTELFPEVDTVMLGRGVLVNPGIIDLFEKDVLPEKDTVRTYLTEIREEYEKIFSGEKNVLYKLKEIWCYMEFLFPEGAKEVKKIKKAQRIADYLRAEEDLFETEPFVRRRFCF